MGPKPITDESLMASVIRGERTSLERLLTRYAGPLWGFVRRLIGDEHRCDEIVQDVFFTLWQKRSRYQSGRPLKPWIFAIALNHCRQFLRDENKHLLQPFSESTEIPFSEDGSPTQTLIATETKKLIERAIDRLPSQQRAVVLLRVWEDLSYADIGEAMNCTESTARSHMHHALVTLRKTLQVAE